MKYRLIWIVSFLLFLKASDAFSQTHRGLYNVNAFPELENAAFNSSKKAGVVTFFGNIPNNALRSDFYCFGANAILHQRKSVTIAANYNFTGEHLMMFNNAKLSYLYHLDFTEDVRADFGLTLGALNPSINMDKVIAIDAFDPALIMLSEQQLWYLDAGLSSVFTLKKALKIGFSLNRFPSTSLAVNENSYLPLPRKLNASVRYDFNEATSNITKGMSLGVWYNRYDSVSRFNVSVNKQLSDQVVASIGYITNPKVFHVGVQILLNNNRLCYSAGLNQQSKLFGNGTEIIMAADFSKKAVSQDQVVGLTEDGAEFLTADSASITDFPDRPEYVILTDTGSTEKVSVYSPLPTDFIVEIERWDDLKKIRMGHDTAKIILKSVKEAPFKPGFYLMIKMSPSENVINDEIKRIFTLGTVSYKLYDPKMKVFYQFVDWTIDEVESSKQLQYFDKEFKYLWIKSFK